MSASSDHAQIADRFHSYAADWSKNSVSALESHWDLADPAPLYVAEEVDTPMLDWDAVRAYWRNNTEIHARIELKIRDIAVKPVADDFALAIVNMDWIIGFRSGASRALGGDNRVMTALRRTSALWRFCAWVEAPLSPITYMRRLYERSVPASFIEALPSNNARE